MRNKNKNLSCYSEQSKNLWYYKCLRTRIYGVEFRCNGKIKERTVVRCAKFLPLYPLFIKQGGQAIPDPYDHETDFNKTYFFPASSVSICVSNLTATPVPPLGM